MSASIGGGSVRCFYAVWPDEPARRQLAAAAALVQGGVGALPVPHENYHVTLAFVGEVAAPLLAVLQQIGRDLGAPSLKLKFDAYEYWPKPQVVVAAVREVPDTVADIWRRLHAELALHGFVLSPKRLRPHATLTRKVTQAPVWPAMSAFEWTARSFSLVRSDSSAAGAVYTVVNTWPLLDESSPEHKSLR
jgi:2'-5' RNA ligase